MGPLGDYTHILYMVEYGAIAVLRYDDGAIIGPHIAAWKAKKARKSCATGYHDMRSAFTSTLQEEVMTVVEDLYDENGIGQMRWRYSSSTITIETEKGRRVHAIGSGGLVGDTACPKDFVHIFSKSIGEWQTKMGKDGYRT